MAHIPAQIVQRTTTVRGTYLPVYPTANLTAAESSSPDPTSTLPFGTLSGIRFLPTSLAYSSRPTVSDAQIASIFHEVSLIAGHVGKKLRFSPYGAAVPTELTSDWYLKHIEPRGGVDPLTNEERANPVANRPALSSQWVLYVSRTANGPGVSIPWSPRWTPIAFGTGSLGIRATLPVAIAIEVVPDTVHTFGPATPIDCTIELVERSFEIGDDQEVRVEQAINRQELFGDLTQEFYSAPEPSEIKAEGRLSSRVDIPIEAFAGTVIANNVHWRVENAERAGPRSWDMELIRDFGYG